MFFHAVFRRNPEIGIQTVANVIAIEHVCVQWRLEQLRSSLAQSLIFASPAPEGGASDPNNRTRDARFVGTMAGLIFLQVQRCFLLFVNCGRIDAAKMVPTGGRSSTIGQSSAITPIGRDSGYDHELSITSGPRV